MTNTDIRVLQEISRTVVSDLTFKIDDMIGKRKRGIDYLNKQFAFKNSKLYWLVERSKLMVVATKRHTGKTNSFIGGYYWQTNNELSLDQLEYVIKELRAILKGKN